MDDLISRQALRSEMYHEAFEKDSDEQRWDGGCWIRYKMFERVVDRQPPAQPKTGKWIYHIDDLFPAESTMECNQCHAEQPLTCDDEFCPHCGAKMEGDGENND